MCVLPGEGRKGGGDVTQKFDKFKKALSALCIEHQVMICAGIYEQLEVWDLAPDDLSPALYMAIDDNTKPPLPKHGAKDDSPN